MQGICNFCTTLPEVNLPVKLELTDRGGGSVDISAVLGNTRIVIACFKNGMYDPVVIPLAVATKMGIFLDGYSHIRSTINP